MFNFPFFKSSQAPAIDAPIGSSITRVVKFLDKHLPDFPNYPQFIAFKNCSAKLLEDDISQELCTFLDRKIRSYSIQMFWFRRKISIQFQRKMRTTARSTDFGFIYAGINESTDHFFLIEAKLLPGNHAEYVKGDQGGIQRFKEEHHGAGLPTSAIIGYIMEKEFDYWFAKINGWVDDQINSSPINGIVWDQDDRLKPKNDFKTVRKYHSKNKRSKDSIELYHYLIDLK